MTVRMFKVTYETSGIFASPKSMIVIANNVKDAIVQCRKQNWRGYRTKGLHDVTSVTLIGEAQ